jgi:hypothetical protein
MKDKSLLEKASLLPSQISSLALELGPGFENVFSVDDMVAAVGGKI